MMLIKVHDKVQIIKGERAGSFGTVEAVTGAYGENLTVRILDAKVLVTRDDVVIIVHPHYSCY